MKLSELAKIIKQVWIKTDKIKLGDTIRYYNSSRLTYRYGKVIDIRNSYYTCFFHNELKYINDITGAQGCISYRDGVEVLK